MYKAQRVRGGWCPLGPSQPLNGDIHVVVFRIVNDQFVALVYTNKERDTCVSWERVGRLEDVLRIIKTQLKPKNIPFDIVGARS